MPEFSIFDSASVPEQGKKKLRLPEIADRKQFRKLFITGGRLVRDVGMPFDVGTNATLVGYLSGVFGGVDGLKGKRVIDVASGVDNTVSSFTPGLPRFLSRIGADVVVVDPAANQADFVGFTAIEAVPEKVQDYADEPDHRVGDILVSRQFLGGPQWSDFQFGDPEYTTYLLAQMAKLAPLQIHNIQGGEFDINAVNSEALAKHGLSVQYNLELFRKENSGEVAPDSGLSEDFLVVTDSSYEKVK